MLCLADTWRARSPGISGAPGGEAVDTARIAKAGGEADGPEPRGGEAPKLLWGHLVEELLREGLRPCGSRRRAEVLVRECGRPQRAVTVAAVGATVAAKMK